MRPCLHMFVCLCADATEDETTGTNDKRPAGTNDKRPALHRGLVHSQSERKTLCPPPSHPDANLGPPGRYPSCSLSSFVHVCVCALAYTIAY